MDGSENKSRVRSTIILLSGPIASGKSTIARELMLTHGYRSISSGNYLRETLGARGRPITREELQNFGDQLDQETNYEWLTENISRKAIEDHTQKKWILDSVRKVEQISSHRKLLETSIIHVHLIAPAEELKSRYDSRNKSSELEYKKAKSHSNEKNTENLITVADLIFDTSESSTTEICELIIQRAGSTQ